MMYTLRIAPDMLRRDGSAIENKIMSLVNSLCGYLGVSNNGGEYIIDRSKAREIHNFLLGQKALCRQTNFGEDTNKEEISQDRKMKIIHTDYSPEGKVSIRSYYVTKKAFAVIQISVTK